LFYCSGFTKSKSTDSPTKDCELSDGEIKNVDQILNCESDDEDKENMNSQMVDIKKPGYNNSQNVWAFVALLTATWSIACWQIQPRAGKLGLGFFTVSTKLYM